MLHYLLNNTAWCSRRKQLLTRINGNFTKIRLHSRKLKYASRGPIQIIVQDNLVKFDFKIFNFFYLFNLPFFFLLKRDILIEEYIKKKKVKHLN